MKTYIVFETDGYVACVVAKFDNKADAEKYATFLNEKDVAGFTYEVFED